MANLDTANKRRGGTSKLFLQITNVPDGTIDAENRRVFTGIYYIALVSMAVSVDRTRTIGSRTRSRGIGSMSRTKTGGATDRSGGIGSNPRIRYIGDS